MAILERNSGGVLLGIPEGAAGIAATLSLMVHLVRQWRSDPTLRMKAEQIVEYAPPKDARAEIEAIQNWVRDNIRYTQDVRDVETLKTPLLTLTSRHGDCDDQSVLVATLLESIGYATRFSAVGFDGPDSYSHVLAEVKLGTRWIGVETTEPVALGWFPQGASARMVRHI